MNSDGSDFKNLSVSIGDLIASAKAKESSQAAQDFSDRRHSQTSRESPFDTLTIALDTAATDGAPYRIAQPFRSVWCTLDTTDTTVKALMFVNSRENNSRVAPLTQNISYNFAALTNETFLTWPAQPGKKLVLLLLREGTIVPGTQIQTSSGGVSLTAGSALTTTRLASIAAATPTILFPMNVNRKTGTWVNDTGQIAFVGTAVVSNTGTNRGIPVSAGASFTWRNPAALYAYFGAAVTETSIMEES
jgi:hypothetical protein